MKCSNCGHQNLRGSTFCEECGIQVEEKTEENFETKKEFKQKETNLDDVLFIPKKKGGGGVWTVLGVLFAVGILGMLFLAWIGSQSTDITNTLVDTNNTTTGTSTNVNGKYFDLNNLQLLDTKMLGNSYGVRNPIFQATLHNSAGVAATNIILRYNFYNSGKQDAIPVDTQYMKITDYLGPGDSTSINTIVETNANTAGNFWWRAEVYSALSY